MDHEFNRQEMNFSTQDSGNVSAILMATPECERLLVLAHGAGAGMRHTFLEKLAMELAAAGTASFRYQFPYMEQRRHVPDSHAVLTSTVRTAISRAREALPGLPLLAGGKSMGARMTSQAAATWSDEFQSVAGLVFFGFPLHSPGKPDTTRADHLANVKLPMLFLQGTRDQFADRSLLRPVCATLGGRATLHEIEGADHSFNIPKKLGKTSAEVMRELAQTVSRWAEHISDSNRG